jgi:hypothetical protein
VWAILDGMNKQEFLAELHATHEPISAAVAAMPDDAWIQDAPGMHGWTRKDVLAHVGWWTDHSVRVITALGTGAVPYERDPAFDIGAQNGAILDEFRDRDARDVRAFESSAFERLVAAIEGASNDELFEPNRFAWLGDESLAEAVAWDSTKHYPEHLPHLTAPRGSA